MTWDTALASVAQAYADKCIWGHNSDASSDYQAAGGTGYVGENLGAGSSSSYTYTSAITSWWDEHSQYTYATKACSGMCGHYTQMAWASSVRLGCGVKRCTSGAQGISWGQATIVVCNYAPGGNFNGNHPYQTGTCPTGLLDSGSTTINFDMTVPASAATAAQVNSGAASFTPDAFVTDLQQVNAQTGFIATADLPAATDVAVTTAPTSAASSDMKLGLQYSPLLFCMWAVFF